MSGGVQASGTTSFSPLLWRLVVSLKESARQAHEALSTRGPREPRQFSPLEEAGLLHLFPSCGGWLSPPSVLSSFFPDVMTSCHRVTLSLLEIYVSSVI